MAIIPAQEKVFMVSNGTNTTYGGSASLKAMQQWYTMEDVTNTVRPYKVFTALLTQSGEYQPFDVYEGTDLYIGSTYVILSSGEGATGDFTNVGAPNNEEGTLFIATGTTPNSWGISYLQYDSGAPIATVLENTIGDIWFGYGDTGVYLASSNNLFTLNKTTVLMPNGYQNGPYYNIGVQYEDLNNSRITTSESTDGLNAPVNNVLTNTPIEIRVYN